MVVLETPYFLVSVESSGLIVIAHRKDATYPDIASMTRDMEAVGAALDSIGRDRKKLLVDLRDGPRRNDPAFEEAMRRLRPRIFKGFRGAAVVVKTAVGALQVKRHLREDGFGAEVFHEEPEAMEYLRGQSVRGEAPQSVLHSRRPSQVFERAETERTSSLPPLPSRPSKPAAESPPSESPSTLPSQERQSWIPGLPAERDRPSSLPSVPQERERPSWTPGLPAERDRPSSLPPPPPPPSRPSWDRTSSLPPVPTRPNKS